MMESSIERLYAEPLKFIPARHPDKVSVKPSSYISFGATQKTATAPTVAAPKPEHKPESPKMKQKLSMAEAVAKYTGKKLVPGKKQKKLLLQTTPDDEDLGVSDIEEQNTSILSDEEFNPKRKRESKSDQEADSESDSDDDDYHTADEASEVDVTSTLDSPESEVASDVSEASESSEASEDDSEDESTGCRSRIELKKQLKDDMSSPSSNSENEDEDNDDEREVKTEPKRMLSPKAETTPPTSPEEDTVSDSRGLPLSDFYAFNEIPEDRGSNGSTRIYKNWRELVNSEPIGLLNQGVTCYMNSAVQSLIHVPALQHYLKDVYFGKYDNVINPRSVTRTLADTSARLWQFERGNQRKNGHFLPRKLIKRLPDINCMMSEWQQEDSHEYFMSLMSRLQEDSTPKGVKLNQSILYDIFGGLLHQSVTCKSCGHISNTQQEFYDLSLSLDSRKKRNSSILDTNQLQQLKERIESEKSHNSQENKEDQQSLSEFLENRVDTNKSQSQSQQTQQQEQQQQQPQQHQEPMPRYSIEQSIREFFSPEIIKIDKKDKTQGGYECENCKKRTVAVKISRIDRAPETLAIHLKRFRFNGIASSKLKTNVSYPANLDLTQYTTSMKMPVKYTLSSVIAHEGRSVSSGHYIAHCRQPDGSWATYDDEYINKIPEKQALKNSSAYVLVYTRLTHKSVEIVETSTKVEPLRQADKKRRAGNDSNYRLNKKKRRNRR